MFNIVNLLIKASRHEHSVLTRAIATLLGATLFLAGIPAFIYWAGDMFFKGMAFSAIKARLISNLCFILGAPWLLSSIIWQLTKGKGTPVPVVPTKYFLENGPYRFTRNPMMLGFFLYLFGWALRWNQWGFLISAAAVEILLCLEIKFIEEPELEGRFGAAYAQYRKKTPFMIPRLKRSEQ